MKLMRAASMLLAAYFVSSLLSQFMVMKCSSRFTSGSYIRRTMRNASALSPPMTMRSGFKQSWTAVPSLRNSGLLTTA